MNRILVTVAFVVACNSSDESAPNYETMLDEDFAMYPSFGWQWAGGGGPVADPDFGYPAPSAFLRAQAVSPPDRFMFTNQGLDARVTAYLQSNMDFGVQFATFRIVPNFDQGFPADAMAVITYRLITNHSANKPVAGFSAGQTAEIECSLNGAASGPALVPYEEGAVAYDLFVTVDASGTHCGYDDTVIASDGETSVTGTYRTELSAFHATNAWFDNLIVRRAM